MTAQIGAPAAPCVSCPYRRDVPSGVWAEHEYRKLPAFDGETWEQPPGVFLCHQNDGRVCSGWAGCHDMTQSLGLRIAVRDGSVSDEVFDQIVTYVSPVPLWESGARAAEHGLSEVAAPSPAACRVIEKLHARRGSS